MAYVKMGLGILLLIGVVAGAAIVLTSSLADASEDILTEKEAYEMALAYAQMVGLNGNPDNYGIRQVTRQKWADLEGDEYPPTTTADMDEMLWLVAFTGDVELHGIPGSSYTGPGEMPADYNKFDYYLLALNASTGDVVGSTALGSAAEQPLAADRPAPRGTSTSPTGSTIDLSKVKEDAVKELYDSSGKPKNDDRDVQAISKANAGGFGGFYFERTTPPLPTST